MGVRIRRLSDDGQLYGRSGTFWNRIYRDDKCLDKILEGNLIFRFFDRRTT